MTAQTIDKTNASEYVGTAMRGRLDDLRDLQNLIKGAADDSTVPDKRAAAVLDWTEEAVRDEGESFIAEVAEATLEEYPLCIDTTTRFEIVLGTGGPEERLIVECDYNPSPAPLDGEYEICRILYRYSWERSAEVVLMDGDFDVAEAFAMRVVPELVE